MRWLRVMSCIVLSNGEARYLYYSKKVLAIFRKAREMQGDWVIPKHSRAVILGAVLRNVERSSNTQNCNPVTCTK